MIKIGMLEAMLPALISHLDRVSREDITQAITLLNEISYALLAGEKNDLINALNTVAISDNARGAILKVYERINPES
jgi:hypothetical protein